MSEHRLVSRQLQTDETITHQVLRLPRLGVADMETKEANNCGDVCVRRCHKTRKGNASRSTTQAADEGCANLTTILHVRDNMPVIRRPDLR